MRNSHLPAPAESDKKHSKSVIFITVCGRIRKISLPAEPAGGAAESVADGNRPIGAKVFGAYP